MSLSPADPAAGPATAADGPIRIEAVETLAQDWRPLRRYRFAYRRRDGAWQVQQREVYDRGAGAVVLPIDPAAGKVVLVRQFRLPIYLNGQADGRLIEAPAGLLDLDRPADAIRREAEEETGYRIEAVTPVLDLAMSPASVNDRLHCFVARIDLGRPVGPGGGDAAEGEDIEVLALPFAEAFAMIADGRIIDAKTILLLYHAKLHGMLD